MLLIELIQGLVVVGGASLWLRLPGCYANLPACGERSETALPSLTILVAARNEEAVLEGA